MNIAMPPGDVEAWRSTLTILHLFALALLIVVVLAWGRHERRWRLLASGLIMLAAVSLTYLLTTKPSDIPIDWITVLHHGLERKAIFHLYARGAQAGLNFAFVLSTTTGHTPSLPDVVWLNLLLALINALWFFHLALPIAGTAWALAWTLVFALNPATFLASFSELPSNLLVLYFLAGVTAWVVLDDPLPQPRPIRAGAYTLCALVTLFSALTRVEVATIGVVALALHTLHTVLGGSAWSAAGRRLRAWGQRPLVFFSNHPAAVGALCLLGWGLSKAGLPGMVGRSQVVSFYPFYPAIFSLFPYLFMLALPLGVIVACLFGFIRALVDFRQFGGLPLSLAVLANVYFAAWFEYFEMGRYASYFLPAVFLLGLFGKAEIDKRALAWSPDWGRAARIGYLMAWFTLPLPGVLEYYAPLRYRPSLGLSRFLLDRDTQREVRYLVALTEQHSQCVFVARVVKDDVGDPKIDTEYLYALFGAPLAQPVMVSAKQTRLEEVIGRHAPGVSCVRLYYGSDCNLNFTDHCEGFIAGHRRIDERRFRSNPYNNPLESGYGPAEIVLATYAWP